MTATVTQVRQALATRLATISALVAAHAVAPDSITPPCVVIKPAPGIFLPYRVTQDRPDLRLVIGLFVPGVNEEAATPDLDGYLADSGASSIYATVEADPKLGNLVDDCSVIAAQGHGKYNYNGIDYYGCEFVVEVML